MNVLCSMAAEGVGLITINRQDKLNCIDVATDEALRDAWAWAEETDAIRCIVLPGAGDRAFCTGADIAEYLPELRRRAQTNTDDGTFGGLTGNWPTRKPIIAAINGLAMGGGLELALACDIRIACVAARFALPEVRWGVIAGGGGVTRLPRVIAQSMATEMLLTGNAIDADAALRLGLVNAVFADRESLMQGVLEIAARIVANAPLAVEQTLDLIRRAPSVPQSEGLALERAAFRGIVGTEDATEGMRAFVQKRSPVYRGL